MTIQELFEELSKFKDTCTTKPSTRGKKWIISKDEAKAIDTVLDVLYDCDK